MRDIYHKFLKKIAHFQVENPYLTLLLLVMLTIAIYGGVSKVKTVASLEQMMPKNIEEIKAFNTLRDNNLGQDMIAIIIQIDRNNPDPSGISDIRDKRVYDYISHLKNLIGGESDILQTYAFSDIINMYGRNDIELFGEIDKETYLELLNDDEIKERFSDYITDDYTTTIILASTDVSADDPRMNLLSTKIKELTNSVGHPPGTIIKFTGTPIIQQRLGELIAKDRSSTKWISTLFVFLITMIIFGTFTSALVPIIIVTMSVTWLYGTMGYTNLPISTLAGGVAAMVIGIGIDFAIHIMNKFKYERKKGMTIKHAIEQAVVDTGTALTATSLTTIAAFLAFLVGRMPEMGRFGILMAIGITYSLIFSLFGLPALLVIEEELIQKIRRKMKFGVEGEFHLNTNKEICKND